MWPFRKKRNPKQPKPIKKASPTPVEVVHSTVGQLFIDNLRTALDLCQYDMNARKNMAYFTKNQLAEYDTSAKESDEG